MKIAVLDDNQTHLQLVEQALTGGDNALGAPECYLFNNGTALLETLKQQPFDVVILDRHVPDMSGDVILQWLRQYSLEMFGVYTIVIMLTNLRMEEDELYSLQSGADDYITKPFSPKRLITRIKRLVEMHQVSRKLAPKSEPNQISLQTLQSIDVKNNPVVTFAGFEFNAFDCVVTFNGSSVHLTLHEFNLALLLLANIGVVISRHDIMLHAWNGYDPKKQRTLTTYVHRLRQKLQLDVKRGFNLRTVYGHGYRLDYDPSSALKPPEHKEIKWSHATHEA